jgi:hypothetical protein
MSSAWITVVRNCRKTIYKYRYLLYSYYTFFISRKCSIEFHLGKLFKYVAGMREETMKLQKERELIEKEKAKLMALTQNLKSSGQLSTLTQNLRSSGQLSSSNMYHCWTCQAHDPHTEPQVNRSVKQLKHLSLLYLPSSWPSHRTSSQQVN